VILFIKAPEDVHPILGQETLLTDNLGILFKPADTPALFVLGTAIGVLSLYGLWLKAKGLPMPVKSKFNRGLGSGDYAVGFGAHYRNDLCHAVFELHILSRRWCQNRER